MNRKISYSIIICLFMLTCIASVSAADINASDNAICLDDDFNELSTILEDSSPDFSLSKENSPIGGDLEDVDSLGLEDSQSFNLLKSNDLDSNSPDSNGLQSENSIFIDDSNFDTYFDKQGFISYDVEANSDIVFGNLSNRYIKLDIPLSLSSMEGTTISNSTIELTEDASASTLQNLNFYANCTSENPDYFTPIYINEADDLRIENNFIYIDYYNGCNYNLAGIYAFGGANNNIIRNNRISIYSKSENNTDKKYIYGIDFSSYSSTYSKENARGNIISYNTIDIQSNYYLNGITLSCAIDTLVDSNNLILKSDSFAYGIVAEYFDSGFELTPSNNFTFTKNTIEASSGMVYAIQFFSVNNVNISSNIIRSHSNATYAISGYGSYNHVLENNDILIGGNDISLVGTNFDAIGTGHSGIYYKENSHDILIKNNLILSNYTLGGDYAIKFDSSSTNNITVIYNNISSTALHGDDSVSCEDDVVVHDNNPYSKDTNAVQYTIFDIYVNTNGNDNSGNGTSDNPFLTLFKALNYLQALNADSDSNTKVKGIIHIGEGVYTGYGSNLRLIISNLNVELIGTGYNKTIIDGASSHWFFEISEESSVSIRNISFAGGVYRQNNVGLIYNKGNLSLENCIFNNSKVPASSAIIYNDGILRLKNNYLGTAGNGHVIYNKGFIDGLYLNFIKDSLNENERIANCDSISLLLTAYVHDDNGNPISGGYVRFFIEGKEILTNSNLSNGTADLYTYSSIYGLFKVSGYYSNSYTNINLGIGKINSTFIADTISVYVKYSADDSIADGSLERPFSSINKALSVISNTVEPVTIYILDNSTSEQIDDSKLNKNNIITIQGCDEKTHVLNNWNLRLDANIKLKNLIFDDYYLVKENTDLTIDNCLFTNSPQSAIVSVNGSLTLLNSNFTNNNVKERHTTLTETGLGRPGAAHLWDSKYYYDKGGAINNVLSNLTILNCNFINNEAYNGGAIYNNQSDLHISNSSFVSNLAIEGFNEDYGTYSSKGGAILQYLGKEVVITDTEFYSNAAQCYGGAFYSLGTTPSFYQKDSVIAGEDFLYYLDGVWMSGFGEEMEMIDSPQDIYFINCKFDSNIAPKSGGAVYILNNTQTQYISCDFSNNMVFTYNNSLLLTGINTQWGGGGTWIYTDGLNNVFSYKFYSVNNGGAIHDNNLKIIDSTFTANTLESGGSIVLPTILTYTAERNNLSKSNMGLSIVNSVNGNSSVYVADSSLLTADDSSYLGINGWEGSYEGPSISRLIPENPSSGSGSGDGSGNGDGSGSGNGDGSGSGDGSGNGNGGSLNWGDIIGALGGNGGNIAIGGEGSGLSDLINKLLNGNGDSSSNNQSSNANGSSNNDPQSDSNMSSSSTNGETSSNNTVKVEGTSDILVEDAGGLNDDGGPASSVGVSSNPLSGQSSDSDADASESADTSSSSPGESGAISSSSKAYLLYENETENVIQKDVNDYGLLIIIILFLVLVIFGYYRESRNDEDKNKGGINEYI